MLADVLFFVLSFGLLLPLLIIIHETGHYFMARIAGVPADRLKFFISFPPYIALKNWQQEWITPPDYDEYLKQFHHYDPRQKFTYFFLAGGILLETLFLLIGIVIIYLIPIIPEAYIFILLFLSIFINLIYIIIDMIYSFRRQQPSGDISCMWYLASRRTIIIFVLFFVIRFGFLYIYFNIL